MQADFERDGDDGIRVAMRFMLDNVPDRGRRCPSARARRAHAPDPRLVRVPRAHAARADAGVHRVAVCAGVRRRKRRTDDGGLARSRATLMARARAGVAGMAVPTGVADGSAGRRADHRTAVSRGPLPCRGGGHRGARPADHADRSRGLTARAFAIAAHRALRAGSRSRFSHLRRCPCRVPRSPLASPRCAAVALAARSRRARADHAARRAALEPEDPRPDLDHRVHDPQPRLHDLRHAVRHRREEPDQAADGRQVRPSARTSSTWTFTLRDGLEFHDGKPVTGEDCVASIPRWGKRDAMGQKLMTFVEGMPVADAEDLPHLPARGLRLRAGGARQALLERAVHHAQARRRRPTRQADRGLHRLGPVRLQEGRVQARRQGGLREERQVQAAQGTALGHSPAARSSTSTASSGTSRCATRRRGQRAASPGEVDIIEQPSLRPAADAAQKDPNIKLVDWNPLGNQYMAASTTAQAVRQPEGAPGGAARVHAGALPAGGRSASRSTTSPARRCSPAARPRSPTRAASPVEVQHEEGAGAAEGLGLRRHADRADEADRPAVRSRSCPTSARSCCARPASRSTCRRWTGRRVVGAPREEGPASQGGWHMFLTAWVSARHLEPARQPRSSNASATRRRSAGRATRRWRSCATSSRARPTPRRRRRSPRRSRRALRDRHPRAARRVRTSRCAARKNINGFVIAPAQHLLEHQEELASRRS